MGLLAQKRYKISKPIRLIELFSGIGAQAAALERLGVPFSHYRAIDFDKYAVKAYNAIYDTEFKVTDIRKVTGSDLGIENLDSYDYIMTYSFPCQDLSVMGTGKGMSRDSDTRSSLLWEVERLLSELQNKPQVLLMENVQQVVSESNKRDFLMWIKALERFGYDSYYKVLNSSDYGVPQDRDRCFMVSVPKGYSYVFPKSIPLTMNALDLLEKEVPEKYYLKEDRLYEYNPRARMVGRLPNRFGFDITRRVYTGLGTLPAVLTFDGGGLKTKVLQSPRIYDDYNGRFKANQDLTPTITTNSGTLAPRNGIKILEPDEKVRAVTPRECWRLMDFTDNQFDKVVAVGMSDRQLYRQAGNSIVVAVLMAIFGSLL